MSPRMRTSKSVLSTLGFIVRGYTLQLMDVQIERKIEEPEKRRTKAEHKY